MRGVKLVRKLEGRFFPISMPGTLSKTTYKIGVEVFPEEGCGPFAVFDNIENAYAFCMDECGRGNEIYLADVEYTPSGDDTLWFCLSSSLYELLVRPMDMAVMGSELDVPSRRLLWGPGPLPTGTILANSVTLLSCTPVRKAYRAYRKGLSCTE